MAGKRTRKTPEQKLAELEARQERETQKLKQTQAKIKDEQQKLKAKQRAHDNHIRFIWGGLTEKKMAEDAQYEAEMRAYAEKHVHGKKDRADMGLTPRALKPDNDNLSGKFPSPPDSPGRN